MNHYLILFHQRTPIMESLINSIKPNIYAHACKSFHLKDECLKYFSANAVRLTKKNFYGNWGGFGIVMATIEGFRQILKEQKNCTHISLLSGVDYPIKPSQKYESFLLSQKNKSFIKYWNFYPFEEMINEHENPWKNSIETQKLRITRYYYNFFKTRYSIPQVDNLNYFQLNRLQRIKHYFFNSCKGFTSSYSEEFIQFIYSFIRKMPREIPLERIYGGSQWLTICREHAEYIVSFHDKNPAIRNFFRHTMLPDETYIQTILLSSRYKNDVINDNLRFIYFEENSKHPKTLNSNDFVKLQNSNAFFARKFNTKIDLDIISKINNEILNI